MSQKQERENLFKEMIVENISQTGERNWVYKFMKPREHLIASVQKGIASGKASACQFRRRKRCRFDPWVGKIPWRRK